MRKDKAPEAVRASWIYYTALLSVYMRTGQRAMYRRVREWRASLSYQMRPGDLRAVNEAKARMHALPFQGRAWVLTAPTKAEGGLTCGD